MYSLAHTQLTSIAPCQLSWCLRPTSPWPCRVGQSCVCWCVPWVSASYPPLCGHWRPEKGGGPAGLEISWGSTRHTRSSCSEEWGRWMGRREGGMEERGEERRTEGRVRERKRRREEEVTRWWESRLNIWHLTSVSLMLIHVRSSDNYVLTLTYLCTDLQRWHSGVIRNHLWPLAQKQLNTLDLTMTAYKTTTTTTKDWMLV